MRTKTRHSIAALATILATIGIAACGDARASAAEDEFAQDLKLASTAVDLAPVRVDSTLLGAMEARPTGAPEPARSVQPSPGNRAVRSNTPTVRAEPATDIATVGEADLVETVAEAPATMEPVAVAPRPTVPVIVQTGGAGDYGGADGGILGGGDRGGVVIRGGGVDGDNCEFHRRGRRGPVYVPVPIAMIPGVRSTPTIATTPTVTRGGPTTIGLGGSRRPVGRTTAAQARPRAPESRPQSPLPRGRGSRIGG
ncbi:MAG: hypothetical protein WD801_09250 [Gemmatimonadaceae bacterium]